MKKDSCAALSSVVTGKRLQLVFRQEVDERPGGSVPGGWTFDFCDTIIGYLRHARSIRRICGTFELLRGCVRIAAGGRYFYCLTDYGRIVHYGWATESVCRHYTIEKGAFVIGPIWSAPFCRGRGLATMGTKLVLKKIVSRGGRVVYIDTSAENVSCRKVIEKCGFGEPLTNYERE